MAEWQNGRMAGMAEWQKEWQNSRMAEMATYVLFTVHTDTDTDDDDDNDTLIFYSIESRLCTRTLFSHFVTNLDWLAGQLIL